MDEPENENGQDGSVSPFGPRRRRANVEGGRRVRHEVKLSIEEEAMLTLRAQRKGWTVPRLLVESTLHPEAAFGGGREETVIALFQAARALAAVGRNLNQIARAVHLEATVRDDATATFTAVRRAAMRVEAALDDLGRRR